MISWRNFVTDQLKGVPKEVSEEENFPKPGSWKEAVEKLNQSQEALLKALSEFPEERLNDKVPFREYRFHFMLYGIIQHDIYHLGQTFPTQKIEVIVLSQSNFVLRTLVRKKYFLTFF
jgi:hypothetical protein